MTTTGATEEEGTTDHGSAPRTRVLVVDDAASTRLLVRRALEREGFVVEEAESGHEALDRAGDVDVVLLDLTLPDLDGMAVLREMRARSGVPVILLTGRASEEDRVQGLDSGADDYVVKPFLLGELAARVRSVVRRAPAAQPRGVLRFDDLVIDLDARDVEVLGQPVRLPRMEFELLAFLATHPRRVFTRDELLQEVWGSREEWQDPATVTEHVRRLRLRVEPDPAHPRWVVTEHRVGYRFEP